MFKSLFKSSKKNNSEQGSVVEVINDCIAQYRSEALPQGILAVASELDISESNSGFALEVQMPFPCYDELAELVAQISEQLAIKLNLLFSLDIASVRQHDIAGVKNIIAVASGKGGVGKSTTAVNLAYALLAEGAKVAILDADIYGPSIPTMLGLQGQKPASKDGKLMQPLDANGLKAMSIGFLVADSDATVWRGPMASSAFSQLLNETDWPELDYLIVDMPPGTGDIQLTLAQKVPVAGSVVVTTPQNVALADAVKGIAMFNKVKVPVLGVIENMSYHICDNCGHQAHIFGQDGGVDIADSYQVALLGQLPLDVEVRTDADLGVNTIVENSTSDIAQRYRRIACKLAAELYYRLDMRSPQTPDLAITVATVAD